MTNLQLQNQTRYKNSMVKENIKLQTEITTSKFNDLD